MARRDLGQVRVGFQAHPFHVRHGLGGEGIVQILRDRVGVESRSRSFEIRGRHPPSPEHFLNPVHQLRGIGGFLNFRPNLAGLGRFEHIIQIGQHGPQGQAQVFGIVRDVPRDLVDS